MLLTRSRTRFRRWRRSRPFWGGLFAALAGAEICVLPLAPMKVMLTQGVAGIPSVLMGLVMIVLGVSVWFAPHYRTLSGILTTLIACAALVLSNLGGFLVGTLLGILGGGLMFAWQPRTPARGTSGRPGRPSGADRTDGTDGTGAPHGTDRADGTARSEDSTDRTDPAPHVTAIPAPLPDPQGAQP
ncbi:DUF6114 domain-containing protein [Streptomyces sp. NPDC053755]|uniref:DUF6114 domain-containing protein n=1 Tax=Streptomyces sp. NPDC053755 TaxID=3155815 RepID=UPI00342E506C